MNNVTKFETFFARPNKQYNTSLADEQKGALEEAIFESLEGIRKDLNLSQSRFSNIIHVAQGTYSSWKDNGKVNLSRSLTLNDIGILKFIDLYDAITSLFADKQDYINWYNIPINPSYDERTPLITMEDDPGAVLDLNRYVNWLINP